MLIKMCKKQTFEAIKKYEKAPENMIVLHYRNYQYEMMYQFLKIEDDKIVDLKLPIKEES